MTNAKTISHDQTLKILNSHGLSATTDTLANKGLLVMDSNFYTYFGIKESYKYNDVMEWLGY